MPIYYEDATTRIYKTSCGPYDNNAYLIVCAETSESLIIDAPMEPDEVLEEASGTELQKILITHNHQDHLYGLEQIVGATQAPVLVNAADSENLPISPNIFIEDGDIIEVGKLKLKAIHTPGHTPGSTWFSLGNLLFSGDTLFPGGPGRSKSPEALSEIIDSITTKLFLYPDEVEVLPGHVVTTTLGISKKDYAVFASNQHPADLSGDVTWLES